MPIETRNPPQRYAIIYLMLGKNYSRSLTNNQSISRSPTIETLLNFFPFFFFHRKRNSPSHYSFLISVLETLAVLVMVCKT